MAKFESGSAVEALEYDFTAHGGKSGSILEPTTGRVNSYFANTKAMMKDISALREALGNVEVEGMSDEDIANQMSKMGDLSGTEQVQLRMVENLALLCGAEWVEGVKTTLGNEEIPDHLEGGSPTYDEMVALPYRVLSAFNLWLMEEIKPKRTTPASRR